MKSHDEDPTLDTGLADPRDEERDDEEDWEDEDDWDDEEDWDDDDDDDWEDEDEEWETDDEEGLNNHPRMRRAKPLIEEEDDVEALVDPRFLHKARGEGKAVRRFRGKDLSEPDSPKPKDKTKVKTKVKTKAKRPRRPGLADDGDGDTPDWDEDN